MTGVNPGAARSQTPITSILSLRDRGQPGKYLIGQVVGQNTTLKAGDIKRKRIHIQKNKNKNNQRLEISAKN